MKILPRLALLSLSALLFSACERQAQTPPPPIVLPERTDLQVWAGLDSSLDQRLDAVERLVPKGATKDEAVKILGPRGRWIDHEDFGSLQFDFQGGFIDLRFERGRFKEVMIGFTL